MNTELNIIEPQSTPPKQKFLPIIISILATAIIIGGGVFALEELRTSREIEKLQQEIFELRKQAQAQTQEEADDMADWRTYRNEEYGFEVRYPENLETGFGGVAEFAFSIKNPNVSIFINPVLGLEGTRKIGTKIYDFVTQEVVADILIDDTQYCPAPELCDSKHILADANHRGKSFVILSSFNQDDAVTEKLVDQILSSFKFLDTSTAADEPISTADWKTYRNEEFGFEVKYPERFEASLQNTDDQYIFNGKFTHLYTNEGTDNPGIFLQIYKKKENENLSDFVKNFDTGYEKLTNQKQITLPSGINAFQYDHIGAELVNYSDSYFIESSDYIYVFYNYGLQYYENVVSTFKFLD